MKDPLDFIEKLHLKSETERKTLAAVVVIFLMLVIIGVWITTFSIAPSESVVAANQSPPFSLFWNFIKDSVEQIYK